MQQTAGTALVSVITIVYNGEKHIEQTIQSVLNQSYKNIEYIIIDGGSTDNTISIIKKYENQLTYWISEKDRGISHAFNKGIVHAKGELVGIINADDWYETGAIERAVQQSDDADIVYGDLRLWKDGKTDFILKGNHAFLKKEMTINHPTVFVKKSCYENFGLFNESFHCAMDYELMVRFMVNGCRFKYIQEIIANMRWEGLSDANWMLGCRETLIVKNKYFPANLFKNRAYFNKHVVAIGLMKFLQRIKLNFLVKFYRSRLSRIKKVYE